MNPLKPGWMRIKLGDVAVNRTVATRDWEADGFDRYIIGKHIPEDGSAIRTWNVVGDGEFGSRIRTIFRAGDIICTTRGPRLKVAVPGFDGLSAHTNFILRSKDEGVLLQRTLEAVIRSERFQDHLRRHFRGSTNLFVNWSDAARYEFSLPPLDEQRRLSHLLVAADEARSAFEVAAFQAEKLRKSLLLDTFDSLKGNGASQIPFVAGEVNCQQIKMRDAGAIQLGRQLSPKYRTGTGARKYLRVANVFDGYIDVSDVNEMDFGEKEYLNFKLQHGDVLLNEGQSRDLVGRSAVFRDEVPDCCFQNTLIRFRPNAGVLSEFAHYYFQYCQYTSRFAQLSKQTTSIAHLGASRFADMNFPLISIDAQKAVVDVMLEIVRAIPLLKARAQKSALIANSVLAEGPVS